MIEVKEDNYTGCLLGGAVGDALGYSSDNTKELKISANTQLSLFTANALLFGLTRIAIKGVGSELYKWVYWAYKDWYELQEAEKAIEPSLLNISWLLNVCELAESRSPVDKTVEILKVFKVANVEEIDKGFNNQYDCVTRVLPVGLSLAEDESLDRVFKLALNVAKLTHSDNNACLSSGCIATFIRSLRSNSFDMEKSIENTLEVLKHYDNSAHLVEKIEYCKTLLDSNIEDKEITSKLGEGFISEECLLLGLYFSIKYRNDFKQGVMSAIECSKNSSAVGFIVGSILGLINGEKGIPEDLRSEVEIRDILLEIGSDLYLLSYSDLRLLIEDKKWNRKYVEKRYNN